MNRQEARKIALRFAAMTLGGIENGAVAETMGKDYSDADLGDTEVRMVCDEIRRIEGLLWKWEGGA